MKQGLYEQSETQKYPIGLRYAVDDRVFRYCYAKEALDAQAGAFMNKRQYFEAALGAGYTGTITAHDIGAKLINFPQGGDHNAVLSIEAHELAGGWFCAGTPPFSVRIKDNKAGGVGELTAITLAHGMPIAIPANTRCYAYPNLYANIVNHGGLAFGNGDASHVLGTVVCVPEMAITPARYFWGLTWGIFYGLCGHWANLVGIKENVRSWCFDYNGAMVCREGGFAVGDGEFQRGGYIMMDGNGANGGDQLCFLQLAP